MSKVTHSQEVPYLFVYFVLFPLYLTGNPQSSDFDIPLMICLLRNFSMMHQPSSGFDALPAASDTSEGDDIARIKYYRNKLAHMKVNKFQF